MPDPSSSGDIAPATIQPAEVAPDTGSPADIAPEAAVPAASVSHAAPPAERMPGLAAAAEAAERALLTPRVRGDRAELELLLDENFREIGQSGRLFTRNQIVAALLADAGASDAAPHTPPPELSEVVATPLAENVVLLTYVLRFEGRWSRRASVWRATGEGGRPVALVFHQGTTIAPG
ncbi:nuclear transport factor 2 family protein [Subtercola sp. YIM 133946]|uniref:nuclear transport factor 2 family protein n=1 Tax=Subtercola sp. YIM 133946 TaxID=3118909 RepID=UPI002F9459C9